VSLSRALEGALLLVNNDTNKVSLFFDHNKIDFSEKHIVINYIMKSSAELTQQAAGYMLAAANAAKREAAENAAIMAKLKSVTTTKVVESKLIPKLNANKPKTEHVQKQPLSRGEIANALFEATPKPPLSRGEIANALFEAAPKPSIYVPQQPAVQACRCAFRCSGVCRQVSVRMRHPGLQAIKRR
jgi:hypothetical protein